MRPWFVVVVELVVVVGGHGCGLWPVGSASVGSGLSQDSSLVGHMGYGLWAMGESSKSTTDHVSPLSTHQSPKRRVSSVCGNAAWLAPCRFAMAR